MKTKHNTVKLLLLYLIICISGCSSDTVEQNEETPEETTENTAKKIVLSVTDYKHEFVGGGVSIGLFLGHHYSMNQTSQDEAIRLLAQDCNMKYFQDYIEIYPSDDPEYFDRRANYVKAAKVYRPELEFSLVGNKFPVDLMHEITVNGEKFQALNTDDPEIYNRLANWWFELFKGFYERGVSVEILNVVNEPDLDRPFRKQHYGLNGDTKEAVSRVFKYAVPKFKEMLDDPEINTLNMKVPLIMGPSTISPNGCLTYMEYFKNNHPDVWNNIDIIATHQYENGANVQLFKNIVNQAEGKMFYQSETHALKGDGLNLDAVFASRDLKAALSLSNLFSTAVNNGVSSWFYFENNYPNVEVHPGGLLSIPWQAEKPIPYKHYYVFKALTSAQPANSNIIGYSMDNPSKSELIAFIKKDQNIVYAHYSNYSTKAQDISITVKGANNNILKISEYNLTSTSEINNGALVDTKTYQTPEDNITLTTEPLSINTIKITFNTP
ncbi:hypothetical protein CLV33_10440 [Jejuia pallidilutea]|uniref:Glycosyl hydrolase family 30 beta sandwich domain-containing protein n=1 Tax=Jejuia pallidilutea TaxID=504487 RepID=A0A362X0H4_9FLAO|nr:hypothetical protein [Jejuia pallidilutea]PQV48835.1 hypothetical protein CLV33_10440 [Jejuia pallidilutea]